MPVRIIRRSEQAKLADQSPAPTIETVEAPSSPVIAEALGASAHPRGWLVGDVLLLRRAEFEEEVGKTKFLLHLLKEGVWYLLRGYDEKANRIRLQSQMMTLDCRLDSTVYSNYVMAVYTGKVEAPSQELLQFVNRKFPSVQLSAL